MLQRLTIIANGQALKRTRTDMKPPGSCIRKPTIRIHRQDAAIDCLSIARQNAQDIETLLQWGLLERRCRNLAEAAKCFRRGLEIHDKNPALWYSYATMLSNAGQIKEAREVFKSALEALPE